LCYGSNRGSNNIIGSKNINNNNISSNINRSSSRSNNNNIIIIINNNNSNNTNNSNGLFAQGRREQLLTAPAERRSRSTAARFVMAERANKITERQ
jgi:hypothetical protein